MAPPAAARVTEVGGRPPEAPVGRAPSTPAVRKFACQYCGSLFQQYGRGRPRKYCPRCSPVRVYQQDYPRLVSNTLGRFDTGRSCGCGRDYLVVPLEESEVCPCPGRLTNPD